MPRMDGSECEVDTDQLGCYYSSEEDAAAGHRKVDGF